MARIFAWTLAAALLAGCSSPPRPPDVARDVGRVDGTRSISSMSATEWRIEQEPTDAEADADSK